MGPSGSGKTTLLEALSAKKTQGKSLRGEIMVNGQILPQKQLRQISGNVEQENALMGSLTVFETLILTAKLAEPRFVTSRVSPRSGKES